MNILFGALVHFALIPAMFAVRCLENIGYKEETNDCSVQREKRSSRISRMLLTTYCLSDEAGKGL